jgi:hypothetical protein
MRFVPKAPPTPVSAARASKDFSVSKGSWVVLTDGGGIQVMNDEQFRSRYRAADNTSPEQPKKRKVAEIRAKTWLSTESGIGAVLLSVPSDGSVIEMDAFKKAYGDRRSLERFSATVTDAVSKGVVERTSDRGIRLTSYGLSCLAKII